MTSAPLSVGFRSERGPILIALMLATGLIAIDSTILATAVPSVVADLGDFTQFPWLFSIYLLAQAVSVPIYSKLSDTVGRKPIILVGIGLFLLGSILCGFAWSMPALIAFRAVQGLGAGAVLPTSITIVGDLYSLAERAKVQGYIASVWAISSVVGPALGGVFSQFVSWRWIFFVNIPLCIIAGWRLIRSFHEKIEPRRHRIDYAGAVTLTIALTAIIMALLEGGQAWAWNSVPSFAAFGVGAIALVAFVLIEQRAAEPIIPLGIFTRRLIVTTTFISLGVGAILIGLTSYVPTYLETTLGVVPIISGLAVAALTLGWPISAALAGRLYLRIGFRSTVLIGIAIAVVGAIGVTLVAPHPNTILVALSCFVIGFGLGWVAAPSLIAAQSSVAWGERGVITGTNMFARSAGSAVGVAVFGAIANTIIAASPNGEADKAAVADAATAVFLAVTVAAALTVIAALAMPRASAHDLEYVAPAEETAGP
ncbi:MDR family MFS transporter [Leifsonia flava]|uniref:MFS transporter n=1 Tax=Orlajensenia leifsoniae TaxID=2561933 RepID=A0A4Y9QS07_9MICO|nr:MDR family MFS transporter [Leifsonia flava]TFV95007.1 MFS transporter [Leifsonia flava]